MTINMEVRKDALRQTQDGLWKLTLTVHPNDMPVDLMVAPMGSRYAMAIVPIRDDESANPVISKTETTEGEKLRTRAVLLCEKDEAFRTFMFSLYPDRGDCKTVVDCLYRYCSIDSRRELVNDLRAQESFKGLDYAFKKWKDNQTFSNQYADNLNRY